MTKKIKNSQKQTDLTVFALDPRGAHAPFAPPFPDMPVHIYVDGQSAQHIHHQFIHAITVRFHYA